MASGFLSFILYLYTAARLLCERRVPNKMQINKSHYIYLLIIYSCIKFVVYILCIYIYVLYICVCFFIAPSHILMSGHASPVFTTPNGTSAFDLELQQSIQLYY